MRFLRDWATDWRGAQMKAVISQTIFTAMATTHGGNREVLRADYDANGWPQTARNEALRAIRKAFAFHIAGDQHLPAVVRYGIDRHGDAGAALAGPAVNSIYPRWFEPQGAMIVRADSRFAEHGDFIDHFGHPLTVLAVANPTHEFQRLGARSRARQSLWTGAGAIRQARRKCFRGVLAAAGRSGTARHAVSRLAGDDRSCGRQRPNGHGLAADVGNLRDVDIPSCRSSMRRASWFTICRLHGSKFQPHVFARGDYTVARARSRVGAIQASRPD